jgi:hypothetical protein
VLASGLPTRGDSARWTPEKPEGTESFCSTTRISVVRFCVMPKDPCTAKQAWAYFRQGDVQELELEETPRQTVCGHHCAQPSSVPCPYKQVELLRVPSMLAGNLLSTQSMRLQDNPLLTMCPSSSGMARRVTSDQRFLSTYSWNPSSHAPIGVWNVRRAGQSIRDESVYRPAYSAGRAAPGRHPDDLKGASDREAQY